MKTLQIYDPAMCCSSGVCGSSVNNTLVQLAAFINGLNQSDVIVERYNLSQQPAAYVSNAAVKALLDKEGTEALPAVFVDNKLVSTGEYPDLNELGELLQVDKVSTDSKPSCCSGGCC